MLIHVLEEITGYFDLVFGGKFCAKMSPIIK